MLKKGSHKLTKMRQVSTRQKVPDRPMPALQWMTGGPTSRSSAPELRTANRKLRNAHGDLGTLKSGQVV